MTSFVRYVLKFKDQDSPYGDLARDLLLDWKVKEGWGYKNLVRHLETMGAVQAVFEIVDDLYYQYRTMRECGFSV